MKLFTGLLLCSLVLGVSSQWYSIFTQAYEGAKDVVKKSTEAIKDAYRDAKKYLQNRHARSISDAREEVQRVTDFFKHGDSGHGREDSRADQAADEWGSSGKDPNHFRPTGLPDKY
ncbi:serum amyloid A-2 protein-like [Hippopotamus amphibius kiboko]|uniref:serum amyloid A-2 protein-like n=1 Tax=Hippopotamus amphibius kiboko TaxID=575201 RepID=UPI002599BDFA|nr:serum amyloid A-2 protein-like [Hippopotamus amphibius kiboko]